MHLTLYTKKGCHLCSAARDALADAGKEFRFTWEEQILREEDPLFERHKYEFPVMLLDGETLCSGRIDSVLLADLLDRRARAPEG